MLWTSSSQTNTFWHKWIPHFTITLMILHFFTWALWLGYRRMNVILERKQSPEAHQKYIGARRFINPEKLWQIKRKHTLTLLWPQLPFFVYQLSQHIPPGIISFKGNAAELVDMHLNSCFSFRFHRITIINVAPTHHILLPGLPVLFTVHRQWQFLSSWQHSKAYNAIHQSLPFCCHLNGLFSKFPRHLRHCLLFNLFVN